MPEDKQHDDIKYYTILYKKMTNISYESVLVTPIPGGFIELKGLNKYIFYDIRVSAATRVGSGPASDPIKVCTDQVGK